MLTLRSDLVTPPDVDTRLFGDAVVNVNGRDKMSRPTQLRLMRPIYPGALDEFDTMFEGDVLLRPRVAWNGCSWVAEKRLYHDSTKSRYIRHFSMWIDAVSWALESGSR